MNGIISKNWNLKSCECLDSVITLEVKLEIFIVSLFDPGSQLREDP